jgi:hypothetical protein
MSRRFLLKLKSKRQHARKENSRGAIILFYGTITSFHSHFILHSYASIFCQLKKTPRRKIKEGGRKKEREREREKRLVLKIIVLRFINPPLTIPSFPYC